MVRFRTIKRSFRDRLDELFPTPKRFCCQDSGIDFAERICEWQNRDGEYVMVRRNEAILSDTWDYTCWPEAPYGIQDLIDKADSCGQWFSSPEAAYEGMRMMMTDQLHRQSLLPNEKE